MDLATETLALRLRPLLRLGGAGVSAPLRVGPDRCGIRRCATGPGTAGRAGVVIGGTGRPGG